MVGIDFKNALEDQRRVVSASCREMRFCSIQTIID